MGQLLRWRYFFTSKVIWNRVCFLGWVSLFFLGDKNRNIWNLISLKRCRSYVKARRLFSNPSLADIPEAEIWHLLNKHLQQSFIIVNTQHLAQNGIQSALEGAMLERTKYFFMYTYYYKANVKPNLNGEDEDIREYGRKLK